MLRSLLLLALAAFVVGCKTASSPAVAKDSAAGDAVRYSWQKDAPAAAVDNSRVVVRAVRPDYALIELSPIEKRDAGARLQLTKSGKNFLVEIIRSDDKSAVVSILAGQAFVPEVRVGDDVIVAVVAQ